MKLTRKAQIIQTLRYNKAIRFFLYPFMNMKRILDNRKYEKSAYSHEIAALRQSHKGERCFIVATGPSLTAGDLEKIKGEHSFGVNKIFLMYEKTAWRPTYYCAIDKDAWIFCKGYFEKQGFDDSAFLDVKLKYSNITNCGNIYRVNQGTYFAISKGTVLTDPKLVFAEQLEKRFYPTSTVAIIALQLAIYMGYKEIYLLGADCSFGKTPDANYPKEFQGRNSFSPIYDRVADYVFFSYRIAKEYADFHGIKIFNATRGGELEVFPRVDLDDLMLANKV
jgi:hypothetical protein